MLKLKQIANRQGTILDLDDAEPTQVANHSVDVNERQARCIRDVLLPQREREAAVANRVAHAMSLHQAHNETAYTLLGRLVTKLGGQILDFFLPIDKFLQKYLKQTLVGLHQHLKLGLVDYMILNIRYCLDHNPRTILEHSGR